MKPNKFLDGHATSLLLVNLFVSCSVYGITDNLESAPVISHLL